MKISTVRKRGDGFTVTLVSDDKDEAKEWRDRLGHKVPVPRTARNVKPSKCKCRVAVSGKKVEVALHRPWQFTDRSGRDQWEMSVDAITIIFKCASKKEAFCLSSRFPQADLRIPDRYQFLQEVLRLAKVAGFKIEDGNPTVKFV